MASTSMSATAAGPPHSALIYSNRRRLHGNDRPPRTPIRTAAALVRMRAAVLRHHHQLRRSPSARAAQARARKGTRLAPQLPRMKALEEFDFTQAPQIPAARIRELAEGGYIERSE